MARRHLAFGCLLTVVVTSVTMSSCSKDEVVTPPPALVVPTVTNVQNAFLYSFDARSITADSLFYLSFDRDSSAYTLILSNYLEGTGFVTLYAFDWGVMRVDTLTRNKTVLVS